MRVYLRLYTREMEVYNNSAGKDQEESEMMMMMELRRVPWTVEEDYTLMNYIAKND